MRKINLLPKHKMHKSLEGLDGFDKSRVQLVVKNKERIEILGAM